MFIGTQETAQRVLRGGYRRPITLLSRHKAPIPVKLLQADGPVDEARDEKGKWTKGGGNGTSGAGTRMERAMNELKKAAVKEKKPHGQTSAGVMKKMGWRKSQLGVGRMPHWKKGTGAHTTTVYKNWKYGKIIVNHSGGFKHIDLAGNVASKGSGKDGFMRLGKNAVGLQEYLNRLQNAPAQQQMNLPGIQPRVKQVFDTPEKQLEGMKITSSKRLGGGINETKILTLEDGSKAVFKHSTTGDDKHEVAAWQMSKLVGMSDMVSPAIMRIVDGVEGSVLQWQEGRVADAVTNPFDGKDRERAAAFDYVIGNTDRHMGNWLLDANNKIHLIDHGLAFKGAPSFGRGFLSRVVADEDHDIQVSPPKTLAKIYVDNKEEIKKVLAPLVRAAEIPSVMARIDELAKGDSWNTLRRDRRW